MKQWIPYHASHPDMIFQDGGAPPHTAKKTMMWWRTRDELGTQSLRTYKSSDGTILPKWLADSPDLSPFEKFWSFLIQEKNKK